MRRNAALFVVLMGCFAFPSAVLGQSGYCRVYRTMTMGSNVACYYCLKCGDCNDPKGALGTWTDSTGGCSDCGAANCFAVQAPMAPAAAKKEKATDEDQSPTPADPGANPAPLKRAPAATVAPAPLKIKKFTQPPSVLLDPDITTEVKKWIVSIDVTDDGVANPVKLFVVTAKTKPKKPDGTPYQATVAKLGFAHEIETELEAADTITAFEPGHGPGQFLFKYKGHDCVAIVEVP
jgi:hypothetical protein